MVCLACYKEQQFLVVVDAFDIWQTACVDGLPVPICCIMYVVEQGPPVDARQCCR